MASKTVFLCRHFKKGIGSVKRDDDFCVMVDLWPTARPFTPKGSRFVHKLFLSPADARQLALDLMKVAQEAADYQRQTKSP